jgi:putative DNA primase/helicase
VSTPADIETARRRKLERAQEAVTDGFHLTDTGNAERLVRRHGHEIRYCAPRKRWLVWDGKRWAWDQLGMVDQLAKATVRAIYGEASRARSDEARAAVAKHAVRSEERGRRMAMVALAQSEQGVPVLPEALDADPWLLNVANGTLDLRTAELRPHNPADLITKVASADYVPGARHELWDRYLADATGGDTELATYLQHAVGYALQGQVTEKAFWFLYGPPDGMKSTFIAAVSKMLGDYAVSAAFTTWLVQTSSGGNRGDIVALMGARLVTSVEVRKGVKFDEEIMKKVTGGDALVAAAKYESEVTFSPSFALWLAANEAPRIHDDDTAFWSRVQRIPFTNPLPKEQQVKDMRERLCAPDVQRAVLAWAVEGCLAWQRVGLAKSSAVEASTAGYREEMDRVAGFFAERCKFGPAASVKLSEFREAYTKWCEENGVKAPLTVKEMAQRLHDRGCKQGKDTTGNVRVWKGVRVLAAWEDPEPGHVGHV